MSARPSWAREDGPRAEDKALAKAQRENNATRQHLRAGVGDLPLDPERRAFELTGQQRSDRNSRPRTRRWRALDKLDAEIDQLTQRHSGAMARLTEAEQAVTAWPLDLIELQHACVKATEQRLLFVAGPS